MRCHEGTRKRIMLPRFCFLLDDGARVSGQIFCESARSMCAVRRLFTGRFCFGESGKAAIQEQKRKRRQPLDRSDRCGCRLFFTFQKSRTDSPQRRRCLLLLSSPPCGQSLFLKRILHAVSFCARLFFFCWFCGKIQESVPAKNHADTCPANSRANRDKSSLKSAHFDKKSKRFFRSIYV